MPTIRDENPIYDQESEIATLRALRADVNAMPTAPVYLHPVALRGRQKRPRDTLVYSIHDMASLVNVSTLLDDPEVVYKAYKLRYVVDKNRIIWFSKSGEAGPDTPRHFQMLHPDHNHAHCLAAGYVIFTPVEGHFILTGIDLYAEGYQFPFSAILWPLTIIAQSLPDRSLLNEELQLYQQYRPCERGLSIHISTVEALALQHLQQSEGSKVVQASLEDGRAPSPEEQRSGLRYRVRLAPGALSVFPSVPPGWAANQQRQAREAQFLSEARNF